MPAQPRTRGKPKATEQAARKGEANPREPETVQAIPVCSNGAARGSGVQSELSSWPCDSRETTGPSTRRNLQSQSTTMASLGTYPTNFGVQLKSFQNTLSSTFFWKRAVCGNQSSGQSR